MRLVLASLLLALPAVAGEAEEVLELARTAICAGGSPGALDLRPLLTGNPRGLWPLCAQLDDKSIEVRIRAAQAIGRLKDPRAAPVLYVHARTHVEVHPAGSPRANLRRALEEASVSIGMQPRDAGFLVRRWMTPKKCPHRKLVAELNARRDLTVEQVMRLLPPARLPVHRGNRWTWYPLDDDWTLSLDGDNPPRLELSPRLPYATGRRSLFREDPPPKTTAKQRAMIEAAAAGLTDPNYRPDPGNVPVFWSGPRTPNRRAAWDLKACGSAMIEPILRRIDKLDKEGQYAALFALAYAGRGPGMAYRLTSTGYQGGMFGVGDWLAWRRMRAQHPDARGFVLELGRVTVCKDEAGWDLEFRLVVMPSRLRHGLTVRSLVAVWRDRTGADREVELRLPAAVHLDPGGSVRGTLVLRTKARPAAIQLVLRVPAPPVQRVRNGTGWTGEVASNRLANPR